MASFLTVPYPRKWVGLELLSPFETWGNGVPQNPRGFSQRLRTSGRWPPWLCSDFRARWVEGSELAGRGHSHRRGPGGGAGPRRELTT